MRLQPLNRFGRWGVFQQPAKGNSYCGDFRQDMNSARNAKRGEKKS